MSELIKNIKGIVYMEMILFTGTPCAGKTTIANQIRNKLDYELFCIDDYKIYFFEKKGFKSNLEKKEISKKAHQHFLKEIEKCIKNQRNIIAEGSFKKIDYFFELCKKYSIRLIVFYLYSDPKSIVERFNERENSRHLSLRVKNFYPYKEGVSIFKNQLDDISVLEIIESTRLEKYKDNLIKIDTTIFEIEKVVDNILSIIKGEK